MAMGRAGPGGRASDHAAGVSHVGLDAGQVVLTLQPGANLSHTPGPGGRATNLSPMPWGPAPSRGLSLELKSSCGPWRAPWGARGPCKPLGEPCREGTLP